MKNNKRFFELLRHKSSHIIGILPLIFYAGCMYCGQLWWLFPFFCASCVGALVIANVRFIPLFVWSSGAALLLVLPCLVVLLEFRSLAPLLGAVFLFFYTSCCVMILITLLIGIKHIVTQPLVRLLFWSGFFTLWWWFVDTLFFSCIGLSCGYVIANPVLCCPLLPGSCVLLRFMGVYGLLVLYMLAAGGIVVRWRYRSRMAGLVAFGAGSILLLAMGTESFFIQESLLPPASSIVAFKLDKKDEEVLERFSCLHNQFVSCCAEDSAQIDLIIGPESCLPCDVSAEPSLYSCFDNQGSCFSPTVILGARRKDEDKMFNTAYVIHQGRITFYYDKIFPLPFLETSSPFNKYVSFLQGLFFSKNKEPFSVGFTSGDIDLCLGGCNYRARCTLCSDFFCTHLLPPVGGNPLMIVMAYDLWFYGSSVADRMLRYTQLWAVRYQTPVLYVAYKYAFWIDRRGFTQKILRKVEL